MAQLCFARASNNMLLILLVVAGACAKTVRYSNVPPRSAIATKEYDLDVPGASPIRIIEAEPLWPRPYIEHRSISNIDPGYTTQQTPTSLGLPVTHEPEQSTVYSSDALNSFLKEYTDNLEKRKSGVSEEPVNRLASLYLDEKEADKERWGILNMKQHNHPYEDKKGWVMLEAVPWSSSKISKWQSNQKYHSRPWDDERLTQRPYDPKPYDSKPYESKPYEKPLYERPYEHRPTERPSYNKYNYHGSNNNNNDDYHHNRRRPQVTTDDRHGTNHHEVNYDLVDLRPGYYSKPTPKPTPYGYDHKPHYSKPEPEWQELRPYEQNRPWQSNKKPFVQLSLSTSSYFDNPRDELITDGRPGDFPRPSPTTYRPYEPLIKDHPDSSIHPSTHPANGNGEWVLVSTTKGYQYPRTKHQRSINVTPDSLGTKRGIRLTVLPPSNDTKINMTTSHGGLLEVESTFQSVEESQKQFHERLKLNRTKTVKRKKPAKAQAIPAASNQKQVAIAKPLTPARNNKPDPTAVLAAVGAGMVPATVAMLMPFINGRKRRSVEPSVVTFTPYELTLQKSSQR